MDAISFYNEDDEEVLFYVIEQTRIAGVNYLLVADSEQEDAEALILKETGDTSDDESAYEIVEDDTELDAIMKVFAEMLDDVEIQKN